MHGARQKCIVSMLVGVLCCSRSALRTGIALQSMDGMFLKMMLVTDFNRPRLLAYYDTLSPRTIFFLAANYQLLHAR